MDAYVDVSPLGVIAVDDKGKFLASKMFKLDAEEAAQKVAKCFKGEEIEEVRQLKFDLEKKGYTAYSTSPNKATLYIRENIRSMAKMKDDELNKFLSQFGVLLSKKRIASLVRRDKLIIETVSALEDLEKITNLFSERIREWYGLHYPELSTKDHERYLATIAEYGEREKIPSFKASMGMSFSKEDIENVREYAVLSKKAFEMKAGLEKYLEDLTKKEMPNTSALVGSLLAARILKQTGSLERLSKMSSSTIQLLGAEKALFRFMKSKSKDARPPRFGILFTHPDVSTAKKELQGKVARLIASKLTITVRTDFYTKEDKSEEAVRDYKEKLKRIMGGGDG